MSARVCEMHHPFREISSCHFLGRKYLGTLVDRAVTAAEKRETLRVHLCATTTQYAAGVVHGQALLDAEARELAAAAAKAEFMAPDVLEDAGTRAVWVICTHPRQVNGIAQLAFQRLKDHIPGGAVLLARTGPTSLSLRHTGGGLTSLQAAKLLARKLGLPDTAAGGHTAAAGVSMAPEKMEWLQARVGIPMR